MRPKVLVVDDEPLMLMLYKKHIEQAGYQLLTANSAEAGLAMVRAEKPALVVIDIIMSGKSGLAALQELKADPATRDLPVIVFSGSVSEAHETARQEAAAAGAARFLTKPKGPAELVDEIRRLVPIEAGKVRVGRWD